jgi:hypothetical protein
LASEDVADDEGVDPTAAANPLLDRDQEPVVPVNQDEVHQDEASEIPLLGLDLAEVHRAGLEAPPASVRHAPEPHGGRDDARGRGRDRRERRLEPRRRHRPKIEGVPVEVSLASGVSRQDRGPSGRGDSDHVEGMGEPPGIPGQGVVGAEWAPRARRLSKS